MEPGALPIFRGTGKGQKAFSVYRGRNFGSCNIQESRHDIPQFCDTVADRTGFQIRQYIFACSDEQWNMAASLIWPGFSEHVVVAELLSVVGGKEKYRIIIEFLLDKSHDQTADLVVQMGDAGIVSDLSLAYQLRICRTCPELKILPSFFRYSSVSQVPTKGGRRSLSL